MFKHQDVPSLVMIISFILMNGTFNQAVLLLGEIGCWSLLLQGARDDTVVRAFTSHQSGPDSNRGVNAICGLSLLMVLSLAPRGFSPGTSAFPSPQKPTFSNSNSIRNQVDEEPLCGCATSKSLLLLLSLGLKGLKHKTTH